MSSAQEGGKGAKQVDVFGSSVGVADIALSNAAATPDILAVVVAYYGDEWLESCLAFAGESKGQRIRVVVADNFGNEDAEVYAESNGCAYVELPGPLGFAEANNQALIKAGFDARFICFLNQDTRSPPCWLENAAGFLDQHPDIGAVTPRISTYEGEGWDPNFVACTEPVPALWDEGGKAGGTKDFYEVPVIPAPAMVIRTDILREIGGFDPIYGSYYEDYDLCHRVRQAGYRIGIWMGATIAHFSGSATTTAEADRRRQRQIVRNQLIYRVRSAGRRRLRRLSREWIVELPRQVGRRLLRRPASKPLGVLLGGYWDVVKVLPRLISRGYDQQVFRRYLECIGWPGVASNDINRAH
jgi:GT2 family glycosyltransferase